MCHRYRLVISCPDQLGIVARVSSFITGHGGSITEASQHADLETGCFFMRYEIRADSLGMTVDSMRDAFLPIAREFDMHWALTDIRQRRRMVLMVSRERHCLVDLLYRWTAGELDCDIAAVMSNYVTEELDAGPIIEQEVHRVSHCHTPSDLVRFGRDVEKAVLARGVRWHLEDRVLMHGNKTLVFA